ncbi:MAG: SGNH/GDSL hydrolase family protein [Candidatus Omnitrophica bacterium]|nr:SGNH/GDSL hydrolase family protein [Candidatus Omnitrophota bacterium]
MNGGGYNFLNNCQCSLNKTSIGLRKVMVRNVFLALVSVIVFFSAAELLCRLKYQPHIIDTNNMFEYDKDKVYALKRNYVDTFAGHKVRTNSFGYRDREIPIIKSSNTIRLLAVGDSITFGHRVSEKQTYPKRLEMILNRRIRNKHFEVINTAVPGNSPFQEYYDLKRGLKFSPDIVIVQFTLNDVSEPYKIFKRYGGRGIDYHGVEDIPFLHYFFMRHSAFYIFLDNLFTRIRFGEVIWNKVKAKVVAEADKLRWDVAAYEPNSPKVKEAWRECLKWIQKEVDLCKSHKIKFILLISPVDFQIANPHVRYAQRVLKDFAVRNNIEAIDLIPYLEGKAVKDYFFDWGHYTPRGHLFVAKEVLYPVVRRILEEKGTGN